MISDSRAQLIKRIFDEAADVSGCERERVLARHCDGDATLRAEVVALLDAEVRARFLEGPGPPAEGPGAPTGVLTAPAPVSLPFRLGRYELIRLIGEGGMGMVFEAAQDNPRRSVAVKLLKGGLLSPDALRRFEYETQILASLRHPGIAQIYEAGTQSVGGVGLPFFAMELVPDARPITEYARAVRLDLRQRLALFVEVCDAVQHGHQKGVIHRDLKPSNIVVDSTHRPRIIDFGIARSVAAGSVSATLLTTPGQIIGTLPYVSPEQCGVSGAGPVDLDVRSDVYSLGVVLYELLCDRPPFDVARRDMLEAMRIIREQPPTRPGTIQRALRGDLESIVLKALDKDRTRRYQNSGDLARDVRHYLGGEPIEAKRDSAWYVLRKTVWRYRVPLAVAATIAFLLAASAVSLSVLYQRQGILLRDVQRERDKALTAERAAEERRGQAEFQSYVANIAAADAAVAANDGGAALRRLADAPARLRNWEWYYLRRSSDESTATLHGPENQRIMGLRFSPSGRYLAGVAHKGEWQTTLQIWDWARRAEVLNAPDADRHIISYSFEGDDIHVQACPDDKSLVRYELEHGNEVERLGLRLPAGDPAVRIAAPNILFGWRTVDSRAAVWFRDERQNEIEGEFLLDASFWVIAGAGSADGRRLVIEQSNGLMHVCDIAAGAQPVRFQAHETTVYGMAFSPNTVHLTRIKLASQ